MRLVLKPDLHLWIILLYTAKYNSGSPSSLFFSTQHLYRNSNRRNCSPPVWPKCPQRPLLVPSYTGATKWKIKFTQKVFVDCWNRCFWPCPRFVPVCCVVLITKLSAPFQRLVLLPVGEIHRCPITLLVSPYLTAARRASSRAFPQPDGHLAASHLELEKTFRAAGRSSAKCLGSCCASRATRPYFPLTFRSATPSGVGACSSALLPKSRVWMRVKHKKQTWMPETAHQTCLFFFRSLAEIQKGFLPL